MEYRVLQPEGKRQIIAEAVAKLEAQHYANAASIVDLQTQQHALAVRINGLVAFLNGDSDDASLPDAAVDAETPPEAELLPEPEVDA